MSSNHRSELRRLARTCYRQRRTVLSLWVAAVVIVLAAAATAGGTFENEFELPGSESQAAAELLENGGFANRAGFQGQLVVQAPDVTDPGVVAEVTALLDQIELGVDDISVTSPYQAGVEHQVSKDRTMAFAELALAPRTDHEYEVAVDEIVALVDDASLADGQLELGGDRFADDTEGGSESIGFLAAMIILLVAFGSVLAMGLPLLTALFGIGTGIGVVTLLANVVTMPSFTLQLVMMLAIGVGIDYALFIVTRYREALTDGLQPADAVEIAIDTAGRSVLFAGATVVVSVLGLLVVGLDVNRALGLAAAVSVAMTMFASVTLLPAMLGFVGTNIDHLGLPHRRRAGDEHGAIWRRWSHTIQRRPLVPALIGLVIVGALAVPAFSMRLGFGDAGNRPTTDTTRRAYDLLAEGFGPGINGPLFLAAQVPDADAEAALGRLTERLSTVDGVAAATPPFRNENGNVALVQVIPASAPQDEATTELVERLRDDIIPASVGSTQLEVFVGGAQAAVVDFADFNAARLPLFIAVILAVSFVILTAVFRSPLVAFKAVIMNLLSIGAAYGVIVAVFQWGWGAGIIGIGREGPIEAWAPMMLFAIVFGLSMDYEVFLLSRIREDYDRTGDNATAVAHGLAATARVITAAAAIMVVVFAGFVLSGDRSLQLFGLGLATAVFVDATIVRLVLVPATMELLGDRNWWIPRWLDRLLPRIAVDAEHKANRPAPTDEAAGAQ